MLPGGTIEVYAKPPSWMYQTEIHIISKPMQYYSETRIQTIMLDTKFIYVNIFTNEPIKNTA